VIRAAAVRGGAAGLYASADPRESRALPGNRPGGQMELDAARRFAYQWWLRRRAVSGRIAVLSERQA